MTLLVMLAAPIAHATTDGLRAYYPLDADDDDAFGGFDGDSPGGANAPTHTAAGICGNAAGLDGVNDHIVLDSQVLALSDFSVSVWFKADTVNDWERVYDFGASQSNPAAFYFTVQNQREDDEMTAVVDVDAGTLVSIEMRGGPVALQTWTHVVFTFDQGGIGGRFYLNGQLQGSTVYNLAGPGVIPNAVRHAYLGRSNWSADPYFDGLLDEVRIYDRSLSAIEAQYLHADPCGPWPDADGDDVPDSFDLCQGADASGDADGDGACADTDCDDGDGTRFPGNPELCDGKDNDCAGTPAVPPNEADLDLDGVRVCQGDCADNDPTRYPGNPEVCDGRDNDCAGNPAIPVDEADADGDGHRLCGNDCVDVDAAIHPNATELCNEIDDDCDGTSDDGLSIPIWYVDGDGDGFGVAGSPTVSCFQPTGHTSALGDCADSDSARNPAAVEVCDGVDQDCDGTADDQASDAIQGWLDADGDGYGNPSASVSLCVLPALYVTNAGDCDDLRAEAYSGADEICDGIDNDCVGGIDALAVDATAWHEDLDNDGYGSAASELLIACTQPLGYRADAGDCDDTRGDANPDATEQCNAEDDDCNGMIDDGVVDRAWYLDADGDNYGVSTSTLVACARPAGYAPFPGDCDDELPSSNPGVVEVCDGQDDNCSGDESDAVDGSLYYLDADGDGWGDATAPVSSCEGGAGLEQWPGDCDDGTLAVNPDATEICDGVDNDCNGLTDESAADAVFAHRDLDDDGHGDPDSSEPFCEGSVALGWVVDASDCDDAQPLAWTGAAEGCDLVDNDCDGLVDDMDPDVMEAELLRSWPDLDGDGFGAGGDLASCVVPAGRAPNALDCDDADGALHPDAPEVCDGQDDDCDGIADEDDVCFGLADTDADGVPDLIEQPGDTDGDGVPDTLDDDDDGDGVPTRQEGTFDPDQDGLPNHVDPDADGDLVPDADERGDTDCDGAPDYLDTRDDRLCPSGAVPRACSTAPPSFVGWMLVALWVRRRARASRVGAAPIPRHSTS